MGKLDLSSSTIDKGIEAAREFLEHLVAPAASEVGLLLKESVALWRFRNQVKILQKARSYCADNGISPSSVSPKLLCPLLEGASLEDEEELQDKWAILLSNLADSEQNVRNHVFPYILSQISVTEFAVLERVYAERMARVMTLTAELDELRARREVDEARLKQELGDVVAEIAKEREEHGRSYTSRKMVLNRKKGDLESELRKWRNKEWSLSLRLHAPEEIPDLELHGYELTNLVRLGLAREAPEAYANTQSVHVPVGEVLAAHDEYVRVDLELEVESERRHLLTDLGVRFMAACTEKRLQ